SSVKLIVCPANDGSTVIVEGAFAACASTNACANEPGPDAFTFVTVKSAAPTTPPDNTNPTPANARTARPASKRRPITTTFCRWNHHTRTRGPYQNHHTQPRTEAPP